MKNADLGGGIEYEQDVLAIGTDSVLLSGFAAARRGKVCDLGCGAGAVMLLMALRDPGLVCDGVELRTGAAEKARRNIERAGLCGRVRVFNKDLREIKTVLPPGAYDIVTSNPPYMPVGGSIPPEDGEARIARTEECCTVEELCAAAAYLLRFGGRFCVVYPPERLFTLMKTMKKYDMEPKRLRLFCRRQDAPPSLVLVEGRRGGREGLEIMPSLFGDSDEFKRDGHTF